MLTKNVLLMHNLLPVEDIAMVFGKSSEGGSHLAALGRAVARQVVRIIIAQAQKALQARTAVIRPCPIIPVGQQQHQAGLLTPSLLSCMRQAALQN